MGVLNPAPGFVERPDHQVAVVPVHDRVVLKLGRETVADTKNALTVYESNYPPRYYFPKADIRMNLLEPTEWETHCPFKGDARYWTVNAGGHVIENGAWAYDEPFDETAALTGFISFYAEKMCLEVNGKKAEPA